MSWLLVLWIAVATLIIWVGYWLLLDGGSARAHDGRVVFASVGWPIAIPLFLLAFALEEMGWIRVQKR